VKDKVVLAYSGGLDTSVAIKWIQEKYGLEIVTLTVDVGQGDDFEIIEQNAYAIGAVKHYTLDAKPEFIEQYVYRAIKANALYQGKYPISTSLARPLIAQKLVETAHKENAIAVAHGCTGKGNDQVRFDVTIKSVAPELKIIAPIREWNLSRDEEIKYANEKGIHLPFEVNKTYSIDQNLWGRSIESGPLEDPSFEPPEDAFQWTATPEKAPDVREYVTIGFKGGVPVTVNDEELNPVALVERVNEIAGRNGVGRIDHMEDRLVGIKSREVYECPGATVLVEAHRDLEKTVLTRHELLFKRHVDEQWTFLVYAGLWMEPLRDALEGFIDETQKRVSGEVRCRVYKGNVQVVGRSSPLTLYDKALATYEGATSFDQSWAVGFIEIWGLPSRAANTLKRSLES
jgi:argininosuccinate synthase